MENELSETYHNPSNPASFSGAQALTRAYRGVYPRKDVKTWMLDQLTYSLHHPARRRFKRNPVVASSVGDVCQADLVDMTAFSGANDGFRYLLTFIDVFSKQAYAVPLKAKSATLIKKAFEKIFETFVPRQLQTDRGLEFKNQTVLQLMKKYDINLYFTYNQDIKAAVVERFNRTLKARMFRFFTFSGTRRWIDVLDELLSAYNHSFHRSIRMRPVDVPNADPSLVFKNLYGKSERQLVFAEPDEKVKFAIGDTVRMRYHLEPMDKGYYPNFTDNTYFVTNIIKGPNRYMYKVKDHEDRIYPRKLYAEDLLKIPADPLYRIERIIRRRKTRNGFEVLVKFLNHPESENRWIPERNIQNVG